MIRLALALALLCLPATALALDYTVSCNRPYETTEQCQFDSNAAAWFERASTWPGAGPIFDASQLVAATYTTFVVHANLDTDAPFVGQTVCQGDPQYCPEPYYRDGCCFSFQEANTELWHMIFTEPVLGILFDEGDAVRTSEFWLAGNFTGGDQQRTAYGLPNLPTSFGFLTDHLVYELHGRQNHEPESGAFCCPVPLFAVAPTAVPEPTTLLLLGSVLPLLLFRKTVRR